MRLRADALINDPDAYLCEPVRFELLVGVGAKRRTPLESFLGTIPLLATPAHLWEVATQLGVKLSDKSVRIAPLDLMIAAICLHHNATLVTFDAHFRPLAEISPLRLLHLTRDS